jgi:hypothetical protein
VGVLGWERLAHASKCRERPGLPGRGGSDDGPYAASPADAASAEASNTRSYIR